MYFIDSNLGSDAVAARNTRNEVCSNYSHHKTQWSESICNKEARADVQRCASSLSHDSVASH